MYIYTHTYLLRLTFVLITKKNIHMQEMIKCEHFFWNKHCEKITIHGKMVAHILLSLLCANVLHLRS
jgi:hypothetical protein